MKRVGVWLSLMLALSWWPAKADTVRQQTHGDKSPAIHGVQGDVKVIYGLSEEQLIEELGVTRMALRKFFEILQEKHVPWEDLPSKLRDLAAKYNQLRDEWQRFTSDDPAVTALRQEARQALESGDFGRVELLLNQASAREIETTNQLQEAATKRRLSAAASKAQNGDVKMIQLAYREAVAYYQQAAELVPQNAPLLLADYLSRWGVAAIYIGEFTEAESALRTALNIRVQILGPEHTDVATSLNNLSACYFRQEKYAWAEPLVREALEIDKKVLGDEHPSLAPVLNNLAVIYQFLGQHDKAEEHYIAARKIDEKVLEPNHPEVAVALNNLAMLYRAQARYAEAEPLQQRALEIAEMAWGPNHPEVAAKLNNLATLYPALGKEKEAEPLHLRAIAITETVLGSYHPSLVTYLIGYANTLCKLGRDAEATTRVNHAKDILNRRTRIEGITGPVSWQVTEIRAGKKKMLNGQEADGYFVVLIVKELRGIGITFTTQWARVGPPEQAGFVPKKHSKELRLLPNGELRSEFFIPKLPSEMTQACHDAVIVIPPQSLFRIGTDDRGQSIRVIVEMILPPLS